MATTSDLLRTNESAAMQSFDLYRYEQSVKNKMARRVINWLRIDTKLIYWLQVAMSNRP